MTRIPIILALLLLAGCETTVKTSNITPQTAATIDRNTAPNQAAAADNTRTLDQALGTDESAVRLDDIINALLLYYSIKRDLPQQLSDLLPLTDGALPLNAPSNKPYVYVRAGLGTTGTDKRVIVYDPAPTTNGRRWCIVLDKTPPGASLAMEPQPIPESAFLGYR